MRRVSILLLVVLALVVTLIGITRLGISTSGVAHAGRTARFGGEPDDNFWQIDITYCRDGIVLAATQQQLSTDYVKLGPSHAAFSLQLTIANPQVDVILPFPIVQGNGSTMVDGATNFLFNNSQAVGTPVQITVERWDHGHDSTDETGSGDDTDHSGSDDVLSDSGVVEDCYIMAPTPTTTDTATPTATDSATVTVTSTDTLVPTIAPTNTSVPTATPTPVPTQTSTPIPTSTATATATVITLLGHLGFVSPGAPRLISVRSSVDLARGGGKGTFDETLSLFLPASAVTTKTAFYLQVPPPASLPSGLANEKEKGYHTGLGFVFVVADGGVNSDNTGPFASVHPMALQLKYDPNYLQGIDPRTLRIGTVDPFANAWRDLPTTVDTFHHTLTARAALFTFIQIRGLATTKAQANSTNAALATLAASGSPRVTMLPASNAALGGVPLDLQLPSGRMQAPVTITATGAPDSRLLATFTLANVTIQQTLTLDAQGYAAAAFTPPAPLTSPAQLRVAAVVSLNGSSYSRATTVTLLPGTVSGPLPGGAPPLWATLGSTLVHAGAHPTLTVQTAAGLTVHAVLIRAGKPLAGFAVITGTANGRGIARLRLPTLPRSLMAGGKSALLQLVVTVTRHGQSSRQILALTVGP